MHKSLSPIISHVIKVGLNVIVLKYTCVACVILSHCEVNVTRAILLCNDVSVFIIRKAQTYANYITWKKTRSKYSNDAVQ